MKLVHLISEHTQEFDRIDLYPEWDGVVDEQDPFYHHEIIAMELRGMGLKILLTEREAKRLSDGLIDTILRANDGH